MSQECPHCGLINPHTTLRCDCGYDFGSGAVKESYLQAYEGQKAASQVQDIIETHGGVDAAFRAVGKRNMIHGVTWCIGGLLVTAFTYGLAAEAASRSGQGTYWVAWGAVFFGALRFLKGLHQYRGVATRKREDLRELR